MNVDKPRLTAESMSYRTTPPGAVPDAKTERWLAALINAQDERQARPTNPSSAPDHSVNLAGAHLTVRGRADTLSARLDHATAAAVLGAVYIGVADGTVRLVETHTAAPLATVAGLEVAAIDLADAADALVAVAQSTRWTDLERERLEALRADLAAFRAAVPL